MTKYIVFADANMCGITREFEILEFDDNEFSQVIKDTLDDVGAQLANQLADSYWDDESGYSYEEFAEHWHEELDPVEHADYIESV